MSTTSKNSLIKLTSDEVNCLIYSYLKDSGFDHSAYTLRNESHLDQSPNISVALPRGELISLLRKAMLFCESEESFHNKGKAKEGPITLLARYRTAADGPAPESIPLPKPRPDILPVGDKLTSVTALPAAASQASNAPTPSTSTPLNGVQASGTAVSSTATLVALNGDKKNGAEDDGGRPKKRARTTDSDEEIVEVLNPNAVKDNPIGKKGVAPLNGFIRTKSGIVLPPDGSPPGTMTLRGHDAEVFACQWNPVQSNILASGGKGGQVIIWKVHELPARGSPPRTEARTPLHSIIAVLPPPPSRRSQDATGDVKMTTELKDLTSMAWNRAGTVLAVGHQDATIQVWSNTGQLLRSQVAHSAPVFDLAWNDDGNKLVSAGLDGISILWDTSNLPNMRPYWHNTGHDSATCCLDAEWIGAKYYATCGTDKRIIIYGIDNKAPKHVFEGHKDEVNQIRLSPNGTILASVSDDTNAMLWDVSSWADPKKKKDATETFVKTLSGGHEKPVSMLMWMPVKHEDGYHLLATFSREAKSACIWDIRNGSVVRKFSEYSPGVPITRDLFTHCFDPTGRFYALGGVRFLVIYSLKTGKPIWTWPFADSYVADVVWQKGHQGRRLAVAKENGLTVVIDVSALGVPELAEAPPLSSVQPAKATLPLLPSAPTPATPAPATPKTPAPAPTVADKI